VSDLDQVLTGSVLCLLFVLFGLFFLRLFLLWLFFLRRFGLLAFRFVFFLTAATIAVFLGLTRTACEASDDRDTTSYLEKVPSS